MLHLRAPKRLIRTTSHDRVAHQAAVIDFRHLDVPPLSPTLSLGVHSCRCPNYGTEAHPDAHDPESTANERGPLSTSSHVGYSVRDPNSQERSNKVGELDLLQLSHVPQCDRSEKKREVLSDISPRGRRFQVISGSHLHSVGMARLHTLVHCICLGRNALLQSGLHVARAWIAVVPGEEFALSSDVQGQGMRQTRDCRWRS